MPKEDKQIFNIPALSRKKTGKRAPSLWEFNPDDFRDLIRRRREKKFVVALSAGKLKIAAHLPLLRLLETLEIEVDELWGVSAGSIFLSRTTKHLEDPRSISRLSDRECRTQG